MNMKLRKINHIFRKIIGYCIIVLLCFAVFVVSNLITSFFIYIVCRLYEIDGIIIPITVGIIYGAFVTILFILEGIKR